MGIATATLRESLLDRKVDALKDAITRARSTWLFATLLTFIIATALFNATLGWTASQVERRAELLHIVSGDISTVRQSFAKSGAPGEKLAHGNLAYLARLVPADDQDKDGLKALRDAAKEELKGYAGKRIAQDSIQIPLIGLSVSGSDLGIVGGIGLAIVGYWLLAALRAESYAFGEFLDWDSAGSAVSAKRSGYTLEELEYAFSSVRHYMIFGVSTPGSAVNLVTYLSFLVPPALMILNYLTSIAMIGSRPRLDYLNGHNVAELICTVVMVAIWLRALSYQSGTVQTLQAWRYVVESQSKGDWISYQKVSPFEYARSLIRTRILPRPKG